ncbi:MAG: hypothetical protein U9P49_13840 [Thermodesulfobacteriota bacterium]|nr:hypothetical protein [Thermodesulfobacteriota bacterium]
MAGHERKVLCETKEDVLAKMKVEDVSFIQFWFTDVLGTLKSLNVITSDKAGGNDSH